MLHLLITLMRLATGRAIKTAFSTVLMSVPGGPATTTAPPPPPEQQTIITGMPPVAIPAPSTTAPVSPPVEPPTTLPPISVPEVIPLPTVPETTAPSVPEVTAPDVPLAPAEGTFLALTNAARANANLQTVGWSDGLASYAQTHLSRIIDTELKHSSNGQLQKLANQMDMEVIGENLGVGSSVDVIQSALLASPSHLENILWPTFTAFGSASRVGSDGRIWTVHIYGSIEMAKGTPGGVPRTIRGIG